MTTNALPSHPLLSALLMTCVFSGVDHVRGGGEDNYSQAVNINKVASNNYGQ